MNHLLVLYQNNTRSFTLRQRTENGYRVVATFCVDDNVLDYAAEWAREHKYPFFCYDYNYNGERLHCVIGV